MQQITKVPCLSSVTLLYIRNEAGCIYCWPDPDSEESYSDVTQIYKQPNLDVYVEGIFSGVTPGTN